MPNIADTIKSELEYAIPEGENLLAVAQTHSGALVLFALTMQMGLLGGLLQNLLSIKKYYAGVTETRLLLLPLERTWWGGSVESEVITLPFKDIQINGSRIVCRISSTMTEINIRAMDLAFGGYDAAEFMNTIRRQKVLTYKVERA